MNRHSVDLSTRYSAIDYGALPENREIELAEVKLDKLQNAPVETVYREPYLPDQKVVDAVDLAIALGRPLLLQSDPGCGKTRLAYAVAYALGLPLEVCYIKSTSRAQDLLYMYDAVNRLYHAQLGEKGPHTADGAPLCTDIRNYIHLGPLGRAIVRAQYGRRSVVLIDEIDKADLDFPNDLLWELDRLEFRVNEASDMHYEVGDHPERRPIVIVTHNEEKALPVAFLRRCIYHYLEFPTDRSQLERILATHHAGNERLSRKAIEVLLRLHEYDLSKKPGLSELIDWVSYLEARKIPVKELDKLPYRGVLLKQQRDQQRVKEIFQE